MGEGGAPPASAKVATGSRARNSLSSDPRHPPCPWANPGEFCHARGPGPGPDSKVAWHCNSLRFNSSGIHYATWHQPLTWLRGGELPGGTGAGSLLGAPLRRRRATSPRFARSDGLEFTVLAPNAPQEIMQNKRGRRMEGSGVAELLGLRPRLPSSPPFPLCPPRNREPQPPAVGPAAAAAA